MDAAAQIRRTNLFSRRLSAPSTAATVLPRPAGANPAADHGHPVRRSGAGAC